MKKPLLLLLGIVLLAGCSRKQPALTETEIPLKESSENIRDLESIKTEGTLRVLRTARPELPGLPNSFSMDVPEVALIRRFAEDRNLKLEWIAVPSHTDLLPALKAGRGDLAANNIRITEKNRQTATFTLPLLQTHETVVTRTNSSNILSLDDLKGKTLLLARDSYRKSAQQLQQLHPDINITPAPPGMNTEELLHQVAKGNYDCTIADENLVENARMHQPELSTIHTFTNQYNIAIALHPAAEKLQLELNRFLKPALAQYRIRNLTDDLAIIKKRGFLRILTKNSATCYFIHRGQMMGFEYEMAQRYAKAQGLDVVMVTPPPWQNIYQWLIEGKGDIIAAGIPIAEQSDRHNLLESCHPYGETPETEYGWIVRSKNSELRNSINAFFQKEKRTATYNFLYKKYFKDRTALRKFNNSTRPGRRKTISPYDRLARKYADEYELDWTLICAQMYQESRFNPRAKSWAGARGLMQLMPATAKEVGIKGNPYRPENSIRGGIKYMRKQMDRIPGEVDEFNKICFTLAAYNGGYGHLIDARNLASQLGLNPDIWEGNVEYAYSLLSKPAYADKARYGYCRSSEIIPYVRQIILRNYAYEQWLDQRIKK